MILKMVSRFILKRKVKCMSQTHTALSERERERERELLDER